MLWDTAHRKKISGQEISETNTSSAIVSPDCSQNARHISHASCRVYRGGIRSALELGPNIGLNLIALQRLVPGLKATAVEINAKAAEECAKIPDVTVVQDAFLNYKSEETFDLTFTFGVLIIQHPDTLPQMYDLLYKHSNRYILMSEYYNPTPTHVNYRGTQDKMFKRDFAGEFMDRFPDVQLVDYGFFYHRDSIFPADDFNWFLMEKR